MFEEGDYFIKFDLSSGYHHIDIHPEHYKFLGFSWTFSSSITRYFHFVVLPFGISSACFVFTKVLRPLTKKWRSSGIRSIIYIDDGINGGKSYSQAKQFAAIVHNDLKQAGFVVNIQKSDFEPKQRGEWLGTNIDTETMIFTVPERKINKVKENIVSILKEKFSSAQKLAKVAGHLSSMHLAIGPLVRLFTRNMYRRIESHLHWSFFYNLR